MQNNSLTNNTIVACTIQYTSSSAVTKHFLVGYNFLTYLLVASTHVTTEPDLDPRWVYHSGFNLPRSTNKPINVENDFDPKPPQMWKFHINSPLSDRFKLVLDGIYSHAACCYWRPQAVPLGYDRRGQCTSFYLKNVWLQERACRTRARLTSAPRVCCCSSQDSDRYGRRILVERHH